MENSVKGKLVTPIGDFNCQSFPILEDKKYFITDEELEKLGKHELKWHYEEQTEQVEVDGELVNKVITKVTLVPNDNSQELVIQDARHEKAEILKWLADNDWKPNKIVTGEWSENDVRWIEYKQERIIKRNRLDELEEILKEE